MILLLLCSMDFRSLFNFGFWRKAPAIAWRFWRVYASGLFNRAYLCSQLPDRKLPKSTFACLFRYLRDPSLWDLSPHPLFNGRFYQEQNRDVVACRLNPLMHYVLAGGQEMRDPHDLFDARFYCSQLEGQKWTDNPLRHYLKKGAHIGLLPFPHFSYGLYRDIVGNHLRLDEIVCDLASNYEDEKRQQYLRKLSQIVLQTSSRCEARGSLRSKQRATTSLDMACDVVIPVKDAVDWCVRSLKALMRTKPLNLINSIIIVVDGCTDESIALLNELKLKNPLLRIEENIYGRGFASACNFGFSLSKASHVLFLNSDCLVTADTVGKLLTAMSKDNSIGLACPLSNNAANLTLPIERGMSFVHMEQFLDRAASKEGYHPRDCCTTVGHCLLVSRSCYEAVNGMDEMWGLGYGEESDLHLRARARGFLGVAVQDAYVYHFGGGTFRSVATREILQKDNHKRFITLWGDSFAAYRRITSRAISLDQLAASIRKQVDAVTLDVCDVIFVLPGISQGIGGVHVVIDLCNFLISEGFDARIVILGECNIGSLESYQEPLFVNPYVFASEDEMLTELKVCPNVVVTTLFSTVPSAVRFAEIHKATVVSLVQGYEGFFESGNHYDRVKRSYFAVDFAVTTSKWLAEKVQSKNPSLNMQQLPLGVDRFLFYPPIDFIKSDRERVRVGIVIRASADKGQFVLRELCDLLLQQHDQVVFTIFKDKSYDESAPWKLMPSVEVVDLPASRAVIAEALRSVDIFIDASLHEGYGLLPLEAMACGACVIASDSGGVSQFLMDGVNGRLVAQVNKPEVYMERVLELAADRPRLMAMRQASVEVAQTYSEDDCFRRYADFFAQLIG